MVFILAAYRPVATGACGWQCPPNFLAPTKICFIDIIKAKSFPPKMYFDAQTLQPGYGHGCRLK